MPRSFVATVVARLVATLVATAATVSSVALAQPAQPEQTDPQQPPPQLSTEPLEQKQYRQALYHYFNGDYGLALNQIGINKERYGFDNNQSKLFAAGLQVSLGLHQQAQTTLVELSRNVTEQTDKGSQSESGDSRSATTPTELRTVAILQLAQQQFDGGKPEQAKQLLTRLNNVSPAYQQQYQLLQQLLNWPLPASTAEVDLTNADGEAVELSQAYLQLNQALAEIEQQQFQRAEQRLIALQGNYFHWLQPGFWQRLFMPSDSYQDKASSDVQRQAVNDYATLVLAQLYIDQQRYQESADLLQGFPEQSPFSDKALYLFAYSASQLGQFDTATGLFFALQQRYPNTPLGWQAALLAPQQLADNQQYQQALAGYQQAEQLFVSQQQQLTDFLAQISNSDDLLSLLDNAQPADNNNGFADLADSPFIVSNLTPYRSQATIETSLPWLTEALKDGSLANQFQRLLELDQVEQALVTAEQRNQWLAQIIELNQQRKQRLLAQLQQPDQQGSYQQQLQQLTQQQLQISAAIKTAEQSNHGKLFADGTEQDWLNRIQRSEQSLASLTSHRNYQEYRQRLERVRGVLHYRLSQSQPQRLWAHKQQLVALQQQLERSKQRLTKVEQLRTSSPVPINAHQRQQRAQQQYQQLVTQTASVRQATEATIHTKIEQFVAAQQQSLLQLLLITRHQMAATIEQLQQQASNNSQGAQSWQ